MAKKNTADKDEGSLVMVGGRIPKALHKAAKHAAVDEGISLQEFLFRALRERVANQERKIQK
jgi:predicted HicB family RNase H-like nuclease